MPVEPKPAEGSPDVSAPPDDYAEYISWHAKQDEPAEPEPEPSAAPEKVAETAEESEPSETPEEPEEEGDEDEAEAEVKPEAEDKPKKRPSGFQRRIDRLTRDKSELAERVARLEAESLAAKPAVTPPEKAAETADADKPKLDDCETHEEWVEKIAAWTVAKAEKAAEAKRTTDAQAAAKAKDDAAHQDLLKSYNTKAETSREAHPDYDEIVDACDVVLPMEVHSALLESEHGPEIVYRLASDPAEAARIGKLSPIAAVAAIGKIEGRIEAEQSANKVPKPKPVSAAPKPVTPISGSRVSEKSSADPDLAKDYNAWAKVRQRELAEK